jgi:hypothetical protein
MNKRTTKKIKQVIGDMSTPISRRVYRRLKKEFSKIPSSERDLFIDLFDKSLNNKDN